MCAKSGTALLTKAKLAKKDEFYTQLGDIEREAMHYREYFFAAKRSFATVTILVSAISFTTFRTTLNSLV